ncbi:MAG: ATP-binding cassette domain-containing protein [Candidatus Methanomethylicaceae archaeon]
MLKLDNVNVFLGPVHVLRDISLNLARNEVVYIIGRNGAGKTTVLKSIMGLVKVKTGNIIFKGKKITNLPPYVRARLGIGYAPEDRRIFPHLTVEENIRLPTWTLKKSLNLNEIYTLFPRLKELRNRKGTYISGGEQKMLAVARALSVSPSLLLLDEPFEGISPSFVNKIIESIKKIIENIEVSILIADSKGVGMRELGNRAYVIDRGRITYHGKVEEILNLGKF